MMHDVTAVIFCFIIRFEIHILGSKQFKRTVNSCRPEDLALESVRKKRFLTQTKSSNTSSNASLNILVRCMLTMDDEIVISNHDVAF